MLLLNAGEQAVKGRRRLERVEEQLGEPRSASRLLGIGTGVAQSDGRGLDGVQHQRAQGREGKIDLARVFDKLLLLRFVVLQLLLRVEDYSRKQLWKSRPRFPLFGPARVRSLSTGV
jgi:hypothetical protein